MDEDERSIDELIEIAEEIPERLGLAEGMAGIRATARGEGVTATVDVQGMLVGLDIGGQALALGPEGLAAEISRLSAEAGTSALREGMRAVTAGCVPQVAAAVEEALGLDDREPAERPAEPGRPSRRPSSSDDGDSDGFVLSPV
ncbi:hypothetical protein [Amycolatopsis alkalitolerans]|uniref:hypothetical protein n=1 Tax=Amycolatopsis alkalitolerans TaxID=2547244 RepID=UPI00190F6BDA|nr:hypothetical protein [Amycolatopsis alkalitolerans]